MADILKVLSRTSRLILLMVGLVLTACGQADSLETTAPPASPHPTAENERLDTDPEKWQQTLDSNPEDPEAHYHLGLILLLSDPDQALSHLEEAQDLQPEYAGAVSRLKAAYRQAAVIDNPAYRLTLTGQAFAAIGEWPLAESALEQAVTEDPEYAEAWAYLGEARQHTSSGEALFALQKAHQLKPNSLAANLFLSMYYRRSDQPLTAVRYLEAAIQLDPDNKDLQADLAQTLVEAGGASKGFNLLQDLVEEAPEDAENWIRLARLSIDNNLQVAESGLPAARQALLLAPNHPEATLLLGRSYLFLGEKVLAERFLTKAMLLDEQNPEPHYYLGILYLNTGQMEQARAYLLEADGLAQQFGDPLLSEQINKILRQYFGE
ncbi:MAG: tetratricopeptide repeat protein [Anaerolineales bacterium]|nr:tetratricopeptide repeat protein [Anaerolineales bacterium]